MKNLYTTKVKMAIFALTIFAFFAIPLAGNLQAQDTGPSGYCVPKTWFMEKYSSYAPRQYYNCMPDYPDRYSYYLRGFGAAIEYVKVTEKESKEVVIYNYSGEEFDNYNGISRCYSYFEEDYDGSGDFSAGTEYDIEVKIKAWYWKYSWGYDYCSFTGSYRRSAISARYFIDWTRDGDWTDKQLADGTTAPEYIKWWQVMKYGSYCEQALFTHSFKVPEGVDAGKTRLRVTASSSTYQYYPAYQYRTNPCATGYLYSYNYSWGKYAALYDYGETEDYLIEFIMPIKATFPDAEDVLYANRWYDDVAKEVSGNIEAFPRPMIELRDIAGPNTLCQYEIRGPLPASTLVYTGKSPSGATKFDLNTPFDATNPLMFKFMKSEGTYTDGEGGVNFSKSGEYYVNLQVWLPGKTDPKVITKRFTVSWANDLSAMDITNPIKFYTTKAKPFLKRYARGNIPLSAVYKNTGKRTVYRFEAIMNIWKAKAIYTGTEITDYEKDGVYFSDTIVYDTSKAGNLPLSAKQQTEIDFGITHVKTVGKYIVEISCVLRSAKDEEAYNDTYPRTVFLDGEPNVWPKGENPLFMFEVSDEIEAAAVATIVPKDGGKLIVNRPFFPMADVENNGISDISDATATMIFQHNVKQNYRVTKQIIVQDIPQGKYNRKTIRFATTSLKHPGAYTGWLIIKAAGDDKPLNDTIRFQFTVEKGVQGTFEVGVGRDFETIQLAMDQLYRSGIEGSVKLVLTDALYNVYSPEEGAPAWDMSTAIMGLGLQEDGKTIHTLSIVPSDERGVARGGVTVRLHTSNGQGIFLGQNIVNYSEEAIIREELTGSQYREFANTPGYITFDGGGNKSLRFELHSLSKNHGSVFYLNRGSENITIKNVLIDNKTPELKDKVYLPRVFHSDAEGFIFEKDSVFSGANILSYSAGIASRGSLFDEIVVVFDEDGNIIDDGTPEGEEGEKRTIILDTIPNSNNVFANNEIQGFGYGILSTGLGVLFNTTDGVYKRYYNTNNLISNNIIYNVSKAGILVGYEEDLTIINNTITDVSGQANGEAAGIQIGAPIRQRHKGFNNLRVTLQGNSINDIRGDLYVNGIRIEQSDVQFTDPSAGFVMFPDEDDDFKLYSNAIWDLKVSDIATERVGINVFSQRDVDKSDFTQLTTPMFATVLLEGLEITNNTVLFEDDNVENAGKYYGIGIQQAFGALLANNAIAIEDQVSNNATVSAALFLQGTNPSKGFITSNRNAFWLGNSGVDVVRFVESVSMAVPGTFITGFIHTGFNGEYQTLRQWRNWTGMDANSVIGTNFMDDYSFINNSLTIKTPMPMASVLNNRGLYLDGKHTDINGVPRGASDERFDIGAIEFNGGTYQLDNEIIEITSPVNYRESFSKFNEAEYVMTQAPVEVEVRLRNNGNITQSGIPVTVKIERDDQGILHEVLNETVYAHSSGFNFLSVSFNLADGLGKEFTPETYAELDMQITDPAFYGMEENVTPLYTITVTNGDDQNNINNVSVKKVRFYLMRSSLELMECTEQLNENYELSADQNILANNLNCKAIESGLHSIGFYNVSRTEAQENIINGLTTDLEYKQDVDRFNRNSWPERSLDFSTYRSLIWADGHNNNLGRYEAIALRNFVNAGTSDKKKNLLVASQEMLRNNSGLDIDYDFNRDIFHATSLIPHTPLGVDANGDYIIYTDKKVTGVYVERGMSEAIVVTGNVNDAGPTPGLLELLPGEGRTNEAYTYDESSTGNNIMGVTHTRMDRNILLYSVDWRHFGNIDNVMRASIDFVEKNDGDIVAVDLLSFHGQQVGSRIDLDWSTASEISSSHFEVERKLDNNFISINKLEAAGNSSIISYYNMVDKKVVLGNTYTYRLKMVDKDGSFDYSNEVVIELESSAGVLTVSEVSPNPVRNSSELTFSTTKNALVSVKLYNVNGVEVATLFNRTTIGANTININASELSSGAYTLVIKAGESMITRKVNIVK